jgi:hypothetical protein
MLTLYDKDGNLVGSWPAISGVRQYQHPSLQGWPNVGSIPEGDYSFAPEQIQKLSPRDALFGLFGRGRDPGSMAAWGTERAFLNPGASTDTMGRSNFSIHGGFWPGSEGCIDLGPNEKAFFSAVRSLGNDPVQLFVKYDRRLETQPNPLANQTFFDGSSDYLGRGTGIAWDGLKDIGNYISDSIVTPAYGEGGSGSLANPDRNSQVLPGNGILSGLRPRPGGGSDTGDSAQEHESPWAQMVREMWPRRMRDDSNYGE